MRRRFPNQKALSVHPTNTPRARTAQARLSDRAAPSTTRSRDEIIVAIIAAKAEAARRRAAIAAQARRPARRIVRIKLDEIARRYAWESKRRQRGPFHARACVRLRELERVFAYRYGDTLPDDDAGREDLIIAAHHIREVGGNIVRWAALWAPWCSPAAAEQIAENVIADPRRWKADKIAWTLGITLAERTLLKLTTIGAIDSTVEQRKAAYKKRKAAAKAAKRRADGVQPRAEYEAESIERARPWEAAGISRATWFRRAVTGL
jgi:hypothetical protein